MPEQSSRKNHALAALACAALLASQLPTHAASNSWNTTNGDWSNPANWTNPTFPNSVDDEAIFSLPGSTVTVSAPIIVGSLLFNNTAIPYTLNSTGSGSITLSSTTGPASIFVSASTSSNVPTINAQLNLASSTVITNESDSAPLVLGGRIRGSGDMTVNGKVSILGVNGANSSWTGNTTVNSGHLSAFSASTLGKGNVTINAGGTVTAGTLYSNQFTLNGGTLISNVGVTFKLGGTLTISADSQITTTGGRPVSVDLLAGSANLDISNGSYVFTGNSSLFSGTLNLSSSARTFLTGALVGASLIVVNPGSSIIVSRPAGNNALANSVAPGALLVQGGYVGIAADIDFRPMLNPASTLGGILVCTSNATFGTNSLDLNAFSNASTLRITSSGSTTSVVGSIASSVDIRPDIATHTFRFGLPDVSSLLPGFFLDLYARLSDHDGAPANLDMAFSPVFLATANAYTGVTTVAHLLSINHPQSLGLGTGTDADGTTVLSGGTLYLGAGVALSGEKVTLHSGGWLTAKNATGTYGSPIVLNGGTVDTAKFSGTMSGTGNFSISGAILAGTGNYTGTATFIGNATVASSTALSTFANHIVDTGTVHFSATPRVSAISFSGTPNNWTGKIDLHASSLIVQASDPADKNSRIPTLANQITTASNGGLWNGSGITSTLVAADATHNTTVSLFDNTDLAQSVFDGQSMDSNSILITRALLGDGNNSTVVDATDFDIWFRNVGSSNSFRTSRGDYNLSGIVDATDFDLWFKHVGLTGGASLSLLPDSLSSSVPQSLGSFPDPSSIPEPASLALLLPLLLLPRRRPKRQIPNSPL